MSKQDNILISCYVACFNEENNIQSTLKHLHEALLKNNLDNEIIVIDDGSTDSSVTKIKQWRTENPKINFKLVTRSKNLGLAKNFSRALKISSGEYFRLICGDDVEPFVSLDKILSHVGKKDLVLPYHTKCPGKTVLRCAISWIYTFLINTLTGHKIKYYNGLTIAKKSDFIKFCRPKLGFSFQADFICQCLAAGRTYVEVGVETVERKSGASTALTFKNFLGALHLFRRIVKQKLINIK